MNNININNINKTSNTVIQGSYPEVSKKFFLYFQQKPDSQISEN